VTEELIEDVIDLPEQVNRGDVVLSLTNEVAQPGRDHGHRIGMFKDTDCVRTGNNMRGCMGFWSGSVPLDRYSV
jgi:hypothetical protein